MEVTADTGHGVVAADVETSTDSYARRFSGAAGSWFLDVQASGVLRLLKRHAMRSILEVGGGHAQLAGRVAAAGYDVAVQGSVPACAKRVRELSRTVPFVCSSMERLPFRDRSFDLVLSVRTLAHVPDPAALLHECARVAARGLLVDFASSRSLNAVSGALFSLKKTVERDTRTYRLLSPAEPARILAAEGFSSAGSLPQFFWPMVLHRLHGRRGLGRILECLPRLTGLTRAFGSPVLALYVRAAASGQVA